MYDHPMLEPGDKERMSDVTNLNIEQQSSYRMEEFKNLALVEKDEYEILPNGWFENLNNVVPTGWKS